MITGHGGNLRALADRLKCSIDEITDMSSNLNPLGPPPGLVEFIGKNINKIYSLPDVNASKMIEAFSEYHGIDPNRVLAGNGTTWFIYTLPIALKLRKMLIAGPSYSDYKDACIMHSVNYSYYMTCKESSFSIDTGEISMIMSDKSQAIDAFVLCNPNNPTGNFVSKEEIISLLSKHKDIIFIIDESYLPFMDRAESISFVKETSFPNLIVLSSMSKIFRIPGLRTGFLCASPLIIDKIMQFYQPWSVNSLAQASIIYIFKNKEKIAPFLEQTRAFIKKEKQFFMDYMGKNKDIKLFNSEAYFILAELANGIKSDKICRYIADRKILIRDCANFEGLSDKFIRFSLKTREQNIRLADYINDFFDGVQ